MSNFKAKGQYRDGEGVQHSFAIEVLSYYDSEEKLFYALCLSLDIVGAGNTEKEALDEFNSMLEDFVKYTCNKGTIQNELIRMGWDVNSSGKKNFKAKAPSIEELKNDPEWADVWAKNPNIDSRQIALPI